jgi:hypothetical protein
MTKKALRNTFLFGLLAAALAALLLNTSLGGKPGGGGGGSGDTGGGTIYFENSYIFSTMNSDGSGKTPLSIPAGEPSRVLHGGHRWFLATLEIPGETYPNGDTRHELFAYSDDAIYVQLTNQPDVQADNGGGTVRWAMADGVVSWIARRWNPVTGDVVDGGIYAAEVVFDELGVPGLLQEPLAPLVPLALVLVDNGSYFGGDLGPDISSHDWAPVGMDFIVHDRLNWAELWVADAVSGITARMLATNHANWPVWSPDGTRIAFQSSAGIDTIAPNGGSRKTIIKWGPTYTVFAPRWSPTGSHLTYVWWDRSALPQGVWDIYRVTAGGGGKTNLTKDIGNTPFAVGWR